MYNTVWTQIQSTELAGVAVNHILQNMYDDYTDMDAKLILHYHNLEHVRSMYQHLHDTKEPYSEVLDWAVLFHDVIYDAKPAKELRSGLYFIQQAEAVGCTLTQDERYQVVQLILHTEKHENLNCPIVRADLHHLANPVKRFCNFVSIMEESMALYDIDEQTFAQNSETYMNGLADRISGNLYVSTSQYRIWDQILQGVGVTVDLARIIQGK